MGCCFSGLSKKEKKGGKSVPKQHVNSDKYRDKDESHNSNVVHNKKVGLGIGGTVKFNLNTKMPAYVVHQPNMSEVVFSHDNEISGLERDIIGRYWVKYGDGDLPTDMDKRYKQERKKIKTELRKVFDGEGKVNSPPNFFAILTIATICGGPLVKLMWDTLRAGIDTRKITTIKLNNKGGMDDAVNNQKEYGCYYKYSKTLYVNQVNHATKSATEMRALIDTVAHESLHAVMKEKGLEPPDYVKAKYMDILSLKEELCLLIHGDLREYYPVNVRKCSEEKLNIAIEKVAQEIPTHLQESLLKTPSQYTANLNKLMLGREDKKDQLLSVMVMIMRWMEECGAPVTDTEEYTEFKESLSREEI